MEWRAVWKILIVQEAQGKNGQALSHGKRNLVRRSVLRRVQKSECGSGVSSSILVSETTALPISHACIELHS